MSSPAKTAAAVIIGIPLGIFALVFFYFLIANAVAPEDKTEQIAKQCQQDYGPRGQAAVDKCRVDLSTRYLAEKERNKLNSAYDRVK